VHSWAGALGAAMALNHPSRVAGLVMLAPVTHPWSGGVAWYNELAVKPVIGWVFTHTLMLPVGLMLAESGAKSVFLPQEMPQHYVRDTAVALLMRPAEFTANAYDMVTLKASVSAQVQRYGEIRAPVVVIAGDKDTTVSMEIHARPFVAAVSGAKLIVLPGVGHIPQNAAPEVIMAAIDKMIADMTPVSLSAVP
jgi:pimeloyl-ACP methyl ester carboxylesterase